jgi:peptidoglycan-associated lipoprotein
MEPVYFDYDDSALRGDAARGLDEKLPILLANPSLVIRIAGHTDERGSAEYNLALGQRRAASSKRYLVERGVADRRISTISYGEERPVALGEGEAAWSQNRRAEFEVLSGGGNLVRPR